MSDDYRRFLRWYEETFGEKYNNLLKDAKSSRRSKQAVEAAVCRETFFVDCWKAAENRKSLKETARMWHLVAKNAENLESSEMRVIAKAAEENTRKAIDAWAQAGYATCKTAEIYEKLLGSLLEKEDDYLENNLLKCAKQAEEKYTIALDNACNASRFSENSSKDAIKSAQGMITRICFQPPNLKNDATHREKIKSEINISNGLANPESECITNSVNNNQDRDDLKSFIMCTNKKVDDFILTAVTDIQKLIKDAAGKIETFKECTSKEIKQMIFEVSHDENKSTAREDATTISNDVQVEEKQFSSEDNLPITGGIKQMIFEFAKDDCEPCNFGQVQDDKKPADSNLPEIKEKVTEKKKMHGFSAYQTACPCDEDRPETTVVSFPGWAAAANILEMRYQDSFQLKSKRVTKTKIDKYFCKRGESTEEEIITKIEIIDECSKDEDQSEAESTEEDTSEALSDTSSEDVTDQDESFDDTDDAPDETFAPDETLPDESFATEAFGDVDDFGVPEVATESFENFNMTDIDDNEFVTPEDEGDSGDFLRTDKGEKDSEEDDWDKWDKHISETSESDQTDNPEETEKEKKKKKKKKDKKKKKGKGKEKDEIQWTRISAAENLSDNQDPPENILHWISDTHNTNAKAERKIGLDRIIEKAIAKSVEFATQAEKSDDKPRYSARGEEKGNVTPVDEVSVKNGAKSIVVNKLMKAEIETAKATSKWLEDQSNLAANKAKLLEGKVKMTKMKHENLQRELAELVKERNKTSTLNGNKRKVLKNKINEKEAELQKEKCKLEDEMCEASEAGKLYLTAQEKSKEAQTKYAILMKK